MKRNQKFICFGLVALSIVMALVTSLHGKGSDVVAIAITFDSSSGQTAPYLKTGQMSGLLRVSLAAYL